MEEWLRGTSKYSKREQIMRKCKLTFLWKIGLVCPPNPACFESYRRFPWAKLLAFPALYCETLWIVCFLHFLLLQKVRLVLGTFTILFLSYLTLLDDHYKFQSITPKQIGQSSLWTVYNSLLYTFWIFHRFPQNRNISNFCERDRRDRTERVCVKNIIGE